MAFLNGAPVRVAGRGCLDGRKARSVAILRRGTGRLAVMFLVGGVEACAVLSIEPLVSLELASRLSGCERATWRS